MKKTILLFLLLPLCFCGYSQDLIFSQSNAIPVAGPNAHFPNAWAGGLNASTFAKYDFDLDGTEDLLLFDRQQNRAQVYLAKQGSYVFSPSHTSLLPMLNGYVLFYDYNKDNKKDLFTSSSSGIVVYKNVSTSTAVKFQLLFNPIPTRYYSSTPVNMSITYLDVPALTDVDKDGDMDILHFYSQTGEAALLETNYSMEKYGTPDSLYFGTTNECWGGFTEVSCTNYYFGNNCKVNYNYRLEHVGAGALAVFDGDGNGFPDLLVGKSDCQNLNYLQNNASGTIYLFNKLVSSYPATTPANGLYFPIANLEDFDFDGVKDLIVSMGLTEELNADLRQTAWFYKNIGSSSTPNFQLGTKNFVQNTMVDVGKNSVPAFADADSDGDQDLFISNSSDMTSRPSSISYFKNIGSAKSPSFQLVDSNYLSLSAYGYSSLFIAFSDLNNDDNLDLAYTAQKGTSFETKVFFNQTGSGLAFTDTTTLRLPVDAPATFCFFPIDSDNLKDVLVGDANGLLSYYKNTGTASSPAFTLVSDNYGGLSSNVFNSQPSISDINSDGNMDLLVVNDSGFVKVCNDFINQNSATFTYTILKLYPFISLGQNLSLATSDLNKDGFEEIVVGNASGGVNLFQFDPIISNLDNAFKISGNNHLNVWPNPTEAHFQLELPEDGYLKILDITGDCIYESAEIASPDYKAPKLESGFYLLNFRGKSGKDYQQKAIVH